MKCPECGIDNPSSVSVCQCGQILSEGSVDLKTSLDEQARSVRQVLFPVEMVRVGKSW